MKDGYRATFRIVAAVSALIIYVLISHYALSLPPEEGSRSAVFALLPFIVAVAVLGWRSRYRYACLLFCAALGALTWRYLDAIGNHVLWVYFIQHVGGNALMAVVFGRSLTGNREPLCSRMAVLAHGPLDSRLAHYTRQVTLAWTLFFALTAGMSALLFAYAPVALWSLFANVLAIPLVALMFAVEYSVRLRSFPDMKHSPILDGIRLYCRGARASPPPTV